MFDKSENEMTRFKYFYQDSTTNEPEKEIVPKPILFTKAKQKQLFKSAILPGWGQYSNQNKGKAMLFAAIEVTSIVAYFNYYNNAKDIEIEFKAYADEHWDYNHYFNSISYEDGVAKTACGVIVTHPMTALKDHHYYENISKYDEFVCGWDDVSEKFEGENGVVYTPNKVVYIDMRTESNRIYRQATMMTTALLFNHVFSALDAAIFGKDPSDSILSQNTSISLNPIDSSKLLKLEIRF